MIKKKEIYDHYIIQGADFKARYWMEPFGDRTHYFDGGKKLRRFLRLKGRKCLIFRYMNSKKPLSADIKYTGFIIFLSTFKWILNTEIYWIMHNIDKETVDTRPFLTHLRRGVLKWSARKIFVTDHFFKERCFPDNNRVEVISFGEKRDGSISPENLQEIKELSQKYDLVALCLGAKGDKYTHFSRLSNLTQLALQNGKRIAFILPVHAEYEGENAIHINERNIDEKTIAPYVDFVYRINNDVSMPFTLYAASGAGIPIVTAREFFTYEIIERYGIGFDEEAYFLATDEQISEVKLNMLRFVQGASWRSLSEKLN